jgi:hypothetical protein
VWIAVAAAVGGVMAAAPRLAEALAGAARFQGRSVPRIIELLEGKGGSRAEMSWRGGADKRARKAAEEAVAEQESASMKRHMPRLKRGLEDAEKLLKDGERISDPELRQQFNDSATKAIRDAEESTIRWDQRRN